MGTKQKQTPGSPDCPLSLKQKQTLVGPDCRFSLKQTQLLSSPDCPLGLLALFCARQQLLLFRVFLPLTVLTINQTNKAGKILFAVHSINQSIFLRCLWLLFNISLCFNVAQGKKFIIKQFSFNKMRLFHLKLIYLISVDFGLQKMWSKQEGSWLKQEQEKNDFLVFTDCLHWQSL